MNKFERRLKQQLCRQEIPGFGPEAKADTCRKFCAAAGGTKRRRMRPGQFFRGQFRFIRRRTWILQLLVVLAFGVFVAGTLENESVSGIRDFWMCLSAAGPMLLLANMEELGAVFSPGMRELQMSAKNSMERVAAVRMVIFGLLDMICILLFVILARYFAWRIAGLEESMVLFLVYGLVPFNLMGIGCMEILGRNCGGKEKYYCLVWAGVLWMGILFLRIWEVDLYHPAFAGEWFLALAVTAGLLVYEARKLFKSLRGGYDETDGGTFVKTI